MRTPPYLKRCDRFNRCASFTAILSVGFCGITSSLEAQTLLPAPAPDNSSVVDQRPPDQSPIATPASGDIDDASQIEYLTRGPLHEAFAEPYEPEPVLSPLVTVEPPEPIDEVPPEFRPEGDSVTWIPGYWAWDDERNDYLWISGVWRQLPPRHRWVPGYWSQANEGYRWINGFWSNTEVAEVQYLPEPPGSLEEGPSAPAPSEQHFYVPGSWVYESNDYRWQPGFWSRSHDNWVWIPSQYIWTPRGIILRQGYWDYDVAYRGVVFTPIHFRQPLYRSPSYTYRPSYTIDTGLNLFVHLFVRPTSRQYYFGDYYGPQYAGNYYPWVTRYEQPGLYDPFYAHYRQQTRDDTNVINWVTTQYRYFENEERYRPPRTIEAQRQFIRANRNANLPPTVVRLATFGDSLESVVGQKNLPFSFQALNRNEIRRFVDASTPLRELSRSRRDVESVNVNLQADVDSPAADPSVRDAIVDGVREGDSGRRENRGVLRLPPVDQTPTTSTETSDESEPVRRGRDQEGAPADSDQRRDRVTDGVRDQRPDGEPSDLRIQPTETDLPAGRSAVDEAMRDDLRPGNVASDVTRPDATRPDVTRPDVTRPDVTRPDVTRPDVTRPDVTRPNVTRPDVTRPDVTRPDVTRPDVTRPDVTRPDVTRPDVTRPDGEVNPLDRATRGDATRQPSTEMQDRIDERVRQAERFRGQRSNEPMRPEQPSDWPRRQPRSVGEPVPGVPNAVEGGRSFRPGEAAPGRVQPGRAVPGQTGPAAVPRRNAPGRVNEGQAVPSTSPEANQSRRTGQPSAGQPSAGQPSVGQRPQTRPTAPGNAGQENQQRPPRRDAAPGNSGGGNKPPKEDEEKD